MFVGAMFGAHFGPEPHAALSFASYGAIGSAAELARAGRLSVYPSHYHRLAQEFASGSHKVDVVLLQLAVAPDGRLSTSLSKDYVVAAARHARVVIAEITECAPWTFGAELPSDIQIDVLVRTGHAPLEMLPALIGNEERRIATYVAGLISDGAVLQIGIGSVPDAILGSLVSHQNLGIHSGVITDRVVELIECGAITNASKRFDAGVTVCGNLFGSQKLFKWAHRNPQLRMEDAIYTHSQSTLSGLKCFTAINSAVEVDLTGQVNSEVVGGHYVGAVGGQLDFVRGANASAGGRAIIALPSTAKQGSVSRIVPALHTVTCPRSDVDVVVTEWGVAELAHIPLGRRAERLIAIAAPQFREGLERAHLEGLTKYKHA